jgi:hypothetical protein
LIRSASPFNKKFHYTLILSLKYFSDLFVEFLKNDLDRFGLNLPGFGCGNQVAGSHQNGLDQKSAKMRGEKII